MARQAARMELDPSPLDQTPDSGQWRRQVTGNGLDLIPSICPRFYLFAVRRNARMRKRLVSVLLAFHLAQ